MIHSVILSSMIDYPDTICSVLFFGGCNFHCEYCSNKTLTAKKPLDFLTDVLPQLRKRKEWIHHVILSGGECTISPDFLFILDTLIENKFIVGIHTNGYDSAIIKQVISKIDFIGMDIKNDWEHYDVVAREKSRY